MPAADALIDHLPPHWRSVWRAAVGFIVLLLIIAGLRIYDGLAVARQDRDAAAEAHALGLPWTVAELQPPSIPPGQANAADLYANAFALLHRGINGPTNSNFEIDPFKPDPRHSQAWRRVATTASAQYGPLFELAAKAAAVPSAVWSHPTAEVNDARELANELADHALLAHFNGDDAEMIDSILSMFALARAVESDHTLVPHLVANGIRAMALDRLDQAMPDMAASTPLETVRLRTLALHLKSAEERIIKDGQFALAADSIDYRQNVRALTGYAWLTRPVLDRPGMNASQRAMAAISGRPGPPLHLSHSQTIMIGPFPIAPPWEPMSAISFAPSGLGRSLWLDRRLLDEIRLTRVLLAVRMYRARTGHWPASVDALVPDDLDAVPRSAVRPAQRRVEFTILPGGRPDGADRPMVYVDGLNNRNQPDDVPMTGYDDTQAGGARADPNGRQWRDADAWPLSAYPAQVMPSTAPTP